MGVATKKLNIPNMDFFVKKKLTCCYSLTSREGISCVTLETSTGWSMVCHRTVSIDTTNPGAGINTVLVDTSSGGRTVIVDQALRPTLNVRVAGVVSDTPAGGGPSLLRALGISSTG